MADRITAEQRRRIMQHVRSKNTTPEVFLRKKLYSLGLRYRIHADNIVGHPDIWMRKYNTAVFVNGCFWHRHEDCKYASFPKTNQLFWQKKFLANVSRDQQIKDTLIRENIRCLIIWECTIKKMQKDPVVNEQTLHGILCFLNSEETYLEI